MVSLDELAAAIDADADADADAAIAPAREEHEEHEEHDRTQRVDVAWARELRVEPSRGRADRSGPADVRVRVDAPDELVIRDARLGLGESVAIGSSSLAALAVGDRSVSRRHAELCNLGDAVEVRDLGSTNGVYVNGVRVFHAVVPLGTEVSLGRVIVAVDRAPARVAAELASSSSSSSAAGACAARGPRVGGRDAPLDGLVGKSLAMRRLAGAVRRVANLRLPVLVRGESGTGKDLVARALHDESARRAAPFVAINCATISRELAESELFGHEKGAFTGALRERRGAFREAHRGTLFLDEIGALPLDLQAKLLRVVEEGAVRPLGGEQRVEVDVRLVTATCEPLEAMVEDRRFRADLFERLAACVVRVPALRERRDDIAELATLLLASSGLEGRTLSAGAIAKLRSQPFPGNVRELRNVVVQAGLRADDVVDAEHVLLALAERSGPARRRLRPADALRFFEEANGNVSEAARRAELPRSTMRDLLRAARHGDGDGDGDGAVARGPRLTAGY